MNNLLVPVDFSDATDRVIAIAEQIGRALGAKLWLLYCASETPAVGVVGEIPMFLSTQEVPLPEAFAEDRRRLADLASALRRRGVDAEEVLRIGSAIDEILRAAEQYQADMIIVGSHGHGALYELLVGTVARAVLHRSGRPTLIVPCAPRRLRAGAAARQQEVATLNFD